MNNWKIYLKRNKGFNWYKSDNIWVKGYLYYKNTVLYNEEIIKIFLQYHNKNEIVSFLSEIDGCYAIISHNNSQIIAIVDRIASIPLYYSIKDKTILDSIDIEQIEKTQLDEQTIHQMLFSGYTINDKTIIRSLKKLNSGQYMIISKNAILKETYYKHQHNFNKQINHQKCYEEIDKISNSVFVRLIKSLKNKKVLLPLSGGYDSRYIAVMLKKFGFHDVLCYTYGKPDSYEVSISRKVAQKLGFEWLFIEYDEMEWNNILKSKFFYDFSKSCLSPSSIPHLQDIIALNKIKLNHDLSTYIIIPGYCADLFGGSYLIDFSLRNREFRISWLVKYIFNKHFSFQCYKDKRLKKSIVNEIRTFFLIHQNQKLKYDEIVNLNEEWFVLHKVEKFIMNSLQTFEYFQLEWRLPLWDKELMNFWYNIQNKYRISSSSLYKKWLFKKLFLPYGVIYKKKENTVEKNRYILLKRYLKRILNYLLIQNLFNSKERSDINNFSIPMKFLFKIIKNKRCINYESIQLNAVYSLFLYEKYLQKY